MTEQANDRLYKGVSILLFSFVFIYLLLRIIFTETLHDEVATYMFYFYQGDYMGDTILWDANNHLLNSFIGNILYQFVGDNIPVLRLPNLVAFVIYFFGTVQLTKGFKTPYLKITSLVALNSIPFIMEYFGNARGYGLSFGFFAWGLVHLLRYFKSYSLKPLFFTYLFMGLAVSANLTFVNTCLLILVATIISPFFNSEKRPLNLRIKEWLFHILFVVGLTPFVLFGLALKDTGALYYGSLDGIWDVTGMTLSKYVLFFHDDWLRFVYIAVFIGFLIYVIYLLRKIQFSKWFGQPYLIFNYLFFGNLLGVLVLAYTFEVNYPEDRTGMYLVILFLLIIFQLLESFSIGKWLQLGLLFFPITFALNLSLHTSVFSPDDRLNNEFYAKVKSHIEPDHSLMIYRILNWNWPYHESHEDEKASVGLFYNENSTVVDILVTKTTMMTNPDISRLYDTIAVHPPSTYIAFKRKQTMVKIPLDTTELISVSSNGEFVNIATIEYIDLGCQHLQLSVEGHLKTTEKKNKIKLVIEAKNKDGSLARYYYYSFETTYQSQLIDDDFLHHFVMEEVGLDEKEIKVYLWNRGLHSVELTNARCILTELKTPENESR